MPVAFVPHGGGPWPFVDFGVPKSEVEDLSTYLRSLRSLPPSPPKAILVVSAHWEERAPTVMTSERPPMLYDYYGFPPESYQITWPARGDLELASRVQDLLRRAGFDAAGDPRRGFDHGAFIPFKVMFPDADMPAIQVSLVSSLDPAEHLAMGRALAPLRDESVFIVGSGMTYHNMRGFQGAHGRGVAEAFDAWLREAVASDPRARDAKLLEWTRAPAARLSHPREEHLLPLMVIAGAAGADAGTCAWNGTFMGLRVSAFHFG